VAIHEQLRAAVDGRRGVAAADSLCEACVMLFDMDAAAISLVFAGVTSGTLGSSGAAARMYDELQFTLGEGPCLDSVALRTPVLIADLAYATDGRWPAYSPAMLEHQIRGIFAIPVVLAGEYVGALDLFRTKPGELHADHLAGRARWPRLMPIA
jgi:GAF domain